MDRQIFYAGQIVRTVDGLQQEQNTMVALAKFSAAVLGTTSIVNGFTCTPTTPASLNILVNPGEVYQMENLEQSVFGAGTATLPQDLAHVILKQGILLDAATFGITPPGTVGFSQNFLVEVQYQDQDTGSTTLPYFNAANPPTPFSGPGGSGTAQNTVRKGKAALQVKSGPAAATGTQTTPSPDAGWVGLFVVTVANGATTITSGNISTYTGAPFILSTLPNVPANDQAGAWDYVTDTGTASNIVVTFAAGSQPVPTTYGSGGMNFSVKAAAGPTGATVINVNGLGNKSLVNTDGSAIKANQWIAGSILEVRYDGTKFQLVSVSQAGGSIIYSGTDTGATNAVTVTLSPVPAAYTQFMIADVKLLNDITAASTINCNGLGVKNIKKGDGTATSSGSGKAGEIIRLVYDGTNFQIQNILSTNFRATSYQVYSSAGTYTWTCPANVTQVKARMVGAGGGGGAGVNTGAGAGGNAGGYGEGVYNVTPGSNYTVTIGAGGPVSSGAGNSGTTTSFSTFMSITGGGGGSAGNGTGGTTGGSSTVTGAQFSVAGGTGQYGSASPSAGFAQGGAGGGSAFVCPSFSPIAFASTVLPGYTSIFGGAGSGGSSTTSTIGNGGAGGDGALILEF